MLIHKVYCGERRLCKHALALAALHGTPVDLHGCLEVLETVAEGNSAAGWNLATSTWAALGALRLPREGAAQVYASGPDVLFAGGFPGSSSAVATDGGYRITGRFRLGSGCLDAAWMLAGCQLHDGAGHVQDAHGLPTRLLAFLPRAAVTVDDDWHVAGLRGTGSHDWQVADVFVPTCLAQVPTAPSPWPDLCAQLPAAVFTSVHLSAVAIGIARRAIDSLLALATCKHPTGMTGLLRERVQVQEAVARAEALLESARAYRLHLVTIPSVGAHLKLPGGDEHQLYAQAVAHGL